MHANPRDRQAFALIYSVAMIAIVTAFVARGVNAHHEREARQEAAAQQLAEARARADHAESEAREQARREFVGPPLVAIYPVRGESRRSDTSTVVD